MKLADTLARWEQSPAAWRIAALVVALPRILQPFWPGLLVGNDATRDLMAGMDIATAGAHYSNGPAIFGGTFGSLGPAYYYLLAVPWLTSKPVLMLSVLFSAVPILTLCVVYQVGRRLMDDRAGWIACFVFVSLPVVVETANPISHNEIGALFGVVALWATLVFETAGGAAWLLLASLSLAAAVQFSFLFIGALPSILWLVGARSPSARARNIVMVLASLAALSLLAGMQQTAHFHINDLASALGNSQPSGHRTPAGLAKLIAGLHILAVVVGSVALWHRRSQLPSSWRFVIVWLATTFPVALVLVERYSYTHYALLPTVPLALVATMGLVGSAGCGRWLRVGVLACSVCAAFMAMGEQAGYMMSPRSGDVYESLRRTESRLADIRGAMSNSDSRDALQLVHGLAADGHPGCSLYSACMPLLEFASRVEPAVPPSAPQRHYRFVSSPKADALVPFAPQLDLAAAVVLNDPADSRGGTPMPLPFHAIELASRSDGTSPPLRILPSVGGPIQTGGKDLVVALPFRRESTTTYSRVHALAGAWDVKDPCDVEVTLDDRPLLQTTQRHGLFVEAIADVSSDHPLTTVVVRVRSCRLILLDVFDEGGDPETLASGLERTLESRRALVGNLPASRLARG